MDSVVLDDSGCVVVVIGNPRVTGSQPQPKSLTTLLVAVLKSSSCTKDSPNSSESSRASRMQELPDSVSTIRSQAYLSSPGDLSSAQPSLMETWDASLSQITNMLCCRSVVVVIASVTIVSSVCLWLWLRQRWLPRVALPDRVLVRTVLFGCSSIRAEPRLHLVRAIVKRLRRPPRQPGLPTDRK